MLNPYSLARANLPSPMRLKRSAQSLRQARHDLSQLAARLLTFIEAFRVVPESSRPP